MFKEEIGALHAQGTWNLVPFAPHKNLVGCKWVYRIKKNADCSIARHKACLVAKGFSQEEGIDYYETFSLVLYMTQPQGFESKHHPSDFVCRLKKSLYGLKQAPHAWNERFTSFLPSLDPSLFIQHSSLGTVVLLLYVDDIILTYSNSYLITSVISALTQEFNMKDLGQLTYFMGLQISYQSTGLFVSQTKYIKELFDRVDLQDSKPCPAPCLPYHKLLKDDGKPYSHPEQYRSIVSALQYLTFTRPDIAFSVNQACQFIHNPMEYHVVAVKRILRYLKGTIDFGIWFKHGLLHLHAYSDVNWAGDPNDCRYVSGFIVYLGSSPIFWASKKQHTVSSSSIEAEYRSLAVATAELAWIRQLFCDMQMPLHVPPLIHCDNISAIALSSNPGFHSRLKHLQINYYFVREQVIRGDLLVQHVSSANQFADILTKGLSILLFQHHFVKEVSEVERLENVYTKL
ncbi:transposable element gene [Prunus dulcis]|uniref:Transposable element protein n=1 Tax=Prunus dulcis TaxID=3755 RepID=A0A4Y1RY97_PRUDU|nr:transposable element gene [Prunus dulcis]